MRYAQEEYRYDQAEIAITQVLVEELSKYATTALRTAITTAVATMVAYFVKKWLEKREKK